MLKVFGMGTITTALMLCGAVFVGLALWRFLVHEPYRPPGEALGPAEREWARREVGEVLAAVAPRVLLLHRLETAVELALLGGVADGTRAAVRGRLGRADLGGVWGDFSRVSALAEEEPVRAIPEVRRVGVRVDGCLEELAEIGRVLRVGRGGRTSDGGENDVRG